MLLLVGVLRIIFALYSKYLLLALLSLINLRLPTTSLASLLTLFLQQFQKRHDANEKLSPYSNKFYIDITISKSYELSINVLLIFDIYDLNGP